MTGLPASHVLDALRSLQDLHRAGPGIVSVVDVRIDGVQWKPFCGSWTCPCAAPDRQPCPEWMGYPDSPSERCPRCGWPEHRHQVRYRIDRLPRNPDGDDDPCPWRAQCSASRCHVEGRGPGWSTSMRSALDASRRHDERYHR